MLPDFPYVKSLVRSRLLRWVKAQVPQLAPVLADIGTFHQHEGRRGQLVRSDASVSEMDFPKQSFQFELDREQMKTLDYEALRDKLTQLAQQMAAAQSRMLFTEVTAATEETGNVVAVGGPLKPQHLLEMLDKMEMRFDPVTLQPIGLKFVMHPELLKKLLPRMKEWESDPTLMAEHERIIAKKREEWRASEDRRKLVD
jgi:hypothetical protein